MLGILILSICFILKINAQNLVSNPGFEIYSLCPAGAGQITNATSWYSPNISTPEYFNACATSINCDLPSNYVGYQNAHNGVAYAGIVSYVSFSTNGREYVQTKLLDTLLANAVYCVSFYVSPADLLEYGCDKIGCYFSSTPVSACGDCLMSYTPQIESTSMISDTSAWVKVSGYFIAVGNEQYLTVGNFRSNANTNTTTINSSVSNQEVYFYIDDISVMLCSDTSISVNELNDEKFKIKLYPNPNNGVMTLNYSLSQSEEGVLMIYDITGKLQTRYELNNTNKQLLINNEQLTNGVYMYHIVINGKVIKSNKIVIIKQ